MNVSPTLRPADVDDHVAAPVETARPKKGYLPTLDGWRAIAIFAVIQFHDDLYRVGRFSNSLLHEYGALGVDLFFAISGFLICSRLLDEERRNGFISLRGFYIRRCFRIMPAAWLYLAVCSLLAVANILPRDWGGMVTSLLMVRNLWVLHAGDTAASWYTIHFWSLSVEEHFYLLLPGLLVVAAHRRLQVLGFATVLATAWTLVVQRIPPLHEAQGVWLRTDVRLSQLLVPALFAILLASSENLIDAVRRWLQPWAVFLLLAAMYLVGLYIRSEAPLTIIVGFPLMVIATVYHPQSWTSTFLELEFLKFLGRISYSIYLWQQLFFLMGRHQAGWPLAVFQHAPISYLASVALATLSYYFVERPLIRIGHGVATRSAKRTQPAFATEVQAGQIG